MQEFFTYVTKFYKSESTPGRCHSEMATHIPSQEQLALAKARKEKKMNKVPLPVQLLSRRWLSLPHAHPKKPHYHQVKIMTWNVCRLLLASYLYFTESLL